MFHSVSASLITGKASILLVTGFIIRTGSLGHLERKLRFSDGALLGDDVDNPIGCFRSIESGCCGAFEDLDTLDSIWVDLAHTAGSSSIKTVTAGIGGVVHSNTIHINGRLIGLRETGSSSNPNLCPFTGQSPIQIHHDAGLPACENLINGVDRCVGNIVHADRAHCVTDFRFFNRYTGSRHHHLVQVDG